MPRNIEIKAIVRDISLVRARAVAMSEKPVQFLHQEDTFFRVNDGRLKLRDFGSNRGELIYYQRADKQGPKESTYSISKTDDVKGLKSVLTAALGVLGIVRKARELYLVNQTRIHLDKVEGLGEFVELEFVLREDQPLDEGHTAIDSLMKDLGLREDDLVMQAYIDLIAEKLSDHHSAESTTFK